MDSIFIFLGLLVLVAIMRVLPIAKKQDKDYDKKYNDQNILTGYNIDKNDNLYIPISPVEKRKINYIKNMKFPISYEDLGFQLLQRKPGFFKMSNGELICTNPEDEKITSNVKIYIVFKIDYLRNYNNEGDVINIIEKQNIYKDSQHIDNSIINGDVHFHQNHNQVIKIIHDNYNELSKYILKEDLDEIIEGKIKKSKVEQILKNALMCSGITQNVITIIKSILQLINGC